MNGPRARPKLPEAVSWELRRPGLRSNHPYQGNNSFIIPLCYFTIYQLLLHGNWWTLKKYISRFSALYENNFEMVTMSFHAIIGLTVKSVIGRCFCVIFTVCVTSWCNHTWCSSGDPLPGQQRYNYCKSMVIVLGIFHQVANMAENFDLHRHNVDRYQDTTWWMGTFIMWPCNGRPSGEHLHGAHR